MVILVNVFIIAAVILGILSFVGHVCGFPSLFNTIIQFISVVCAGSLFIIICYWHVTDIISYNKDYNKNLKFCQSEGYTRTDSIIDGTDDRRWVCVDDDRVVSIKELNESKETR